MMIDYFYRKNDCKLNLIANFASKLQKIDLK